MSASAVTPARSGSTDTDSRAVRSASDETEDRDTAPEVVTRTVTGFNGNRRVPPPVNEPVKSYAPGSPERAALKARLRSMSDERADIPLIIGGEEFHTGALAESVMPHNHRHVLGQWHRAGAENIDQAIAARKARRERLGKLAVGGSRGGISESRRAAGDDVAIDAQRGDNARPIEDGVPGRDRCRV